ncbi:MAG: hypothetical protein ACE5GX_02440 [Thermoanaerobaculia bacterium]
MPITPQSVTGPAAAPPELGSPRAPGGVFSQLPEWPAFEAQTPVGPGQGSPRSRLGRRGHASPTDAPLSIHIGSVEVRAVQPAPEPPPPAPFRPRLTLDEYLRQRKSGLR